MINWDYVYKLKAAEFSEDPNKYAEPELIYSLGKFRKLNKSCMYPSPVRGALARFSGSKTSQHFVGSAIVRKSTASDIFIENSAFKNYTNILSSGLFNGIGIYLDTVGPDGLPWILFHLDIRPNTSKTPTPLIWIVIKEYSEVRKKVVNRYLYPQTNFKYWSLLNDSRFHFNKKFGS